MTNLEICDPLYGDTRFDDAVRKLIFTPAVQRLRHVRLSNIDSLSLPGFAATSRYEHALGTAALTAHLGFFGNLMPEERVVLQAAALIHDIGITPYGHLVEEALAYVGNTFDHETKWQQLADERTASQPGGPQSQIYLGRESGLRSWAESTFGRGSWRGPLRAVFGAVRGEGAYGAVVAGQVDVDNIDNIARAAFHIGIPCDRSLPCRLAGAIRGIDRGRLVMDRENTALVSSWLDLREAVYEKLMLSEMDYSGKAMLLAAATAACEDGVVTDDDWRLTDSEFTSLLLSSKSERARRPLEQWLVGELWTMSDIVWMRGKMPSLPEMYRFSGRMSEEFGRCMAYRISDKRTREVELSLTNGEAVTLGRKPQDWLCGVAIDRPRVSANDRARILEATEAAFGAERIGYAFGRTEAGPSLFDE